MAVTPLSGQTICSTFNQLVITDGTFVYDAAGNLINITSLTSVSASYAATSTSASYAATASYIGGGIGPVTISGSVIISGSQVISGSSAVYGPFTVSGSTILSGSTSIVGPTSITGSLTVTGGITGSLLGTASYAMIAATASYINVTGSGILVNWNGSQLQLTASAVSIQTGSIITTGSVGLVQAVTGTLNIQTSSILSLIATGSLLGTASAALFASQSISSSYAVSTSVAISSSYATTASHAFIALQAVSSSYAISSSIAQTSSYIRVVNGPGIEPIQYLGDGFAISASLRSVNGVFPTNGNVNTALTSVITGLSSSLILSSSGTATGSFSEGTVWVVSGETGSASGSNGLSYIFDSASAANGYSGSWLKLSSFDYATADARYVMLNGANTPMLGQLNMGGYNITNLATASNPGDAVPLSQLTQSLSGYLLTASFNTWTGSNTSSIAGTASYALSASLTVTASYAISSSYALSSSYTISSSYALSSSNALSASYAITASYVDITGSGIKVNYNGSQIQLTGSDAVGFVYTSSAVAQVLSSSISQSGDLRIDNGLFILSQVSMSLNFVNDAAAAAGGVPLGGLYRTGNMIVIRLA